MWVRRQAQSNTMREFVQYGHGGVDNRAGHSGMPLLDFILAFQAEGDYLHSEPFTIASGKAMAASSSRLGISRLKIISFARLVDHTGKERGKWCRSKG